MMQAILIGLALGLATGAMAEKNPQQTVNNLKQIGLAIAQWSADYDDDLPDMKSLKNFKQALAQYAPDGKVFLDALTVEPLRLNEALAGHKWQEDAEQVLVFTRAREDGSRVALFNDGHVEVVGKARWEELRRNQTIIEKDEAAEQQLQNLEALGKALGEYVQDGDKTLPPLADLAATRSALLPYAQMQDVFVRPGTTEPYAANASLARQKFAAITAAGEIVVFFEAAPLTNATRGVLYLDGKVARIPESQWPTVKARSGIK